MVSAGTLKNIMSPGRVVETAASNWTLHAAVTSIEMAALAQSETVGFVFTKKLAWVGF